MKATLRPILLLASLVLGLQWAHAQSLTPVPPSGYRVTDLTDTLSVTEAETLTHKLEGLEQRTGAQMRILLVSTLGDETVESYAKRVYNDWHPGRPGVNDGIVMVLAKHERKMRLEVGTGLESALPADIGRQVVSAAASHFKKGAFAQGFSTAIDTTGARLQSVAPAQATEQPVAQALVQAPAPASVTSTGDSDNTAVFVILGGAAVIGVFFLMMRNARIRARKDEERREYLRREREREREDRARHQVARSSDRPHSFAASLSKAPPAPSPTQLPGRAPSPRPASNPHVSSAAPRVEDNRRYRDDDVANSSNDLTTAAMLMAASTPAPAPSYYEPPARVYEAPAPAPTYYSPPPPAPAPSSWPRSDDDSSSRSSGVTTSWSSDSSSPSSSDTSSVSGDY